jgi:chromosome partitioning protein
MSYRICIVNEKGGVAKTTTATSIGSILAEQGYRTMLVDLDPQANLTLAFGWEPANIHKTSAGILLEGLSIQEVVKNTNHLNLDLLPSNSQMGLVERLLPSRSHYELGLHQALKDFSAHYDFIIFDCPPFLGAVTLNALVVSNLLLIPTQAEFFSIYALKNLMGLIKRVRYQHNPEITYRLLLTMYDRRNRTHREMSEQLKRSFQTGVMDTVIEIDTKLRESPISGLPIIYHAPKTRASLQYRALAQEISDYVKETTLQQA